MSETLITKSSMKNFKNDNNLSENKNKLNVIKKKVKYVEFVTYKKKQKIIL